MLVLASELERETGAGVCVRKRLAAEMVAQWTAAWKAPEPLSFTS